MSASCRASSRTVWTDGLDYYSEYIDRGEVSRPAIRKPSADFLRSKYGDCASTSSSRCRSLALEFIGDHRNELFPDTPVVFFATSSATRRMLNSTGVVVRSWTSRGHSDLAAAPAAGAPAVWSSSAAPMPGSVDDERAGASAVLAQARISTHDQPTWRASRRKRYAHGSHSRRGTVPGLVYYPVANRDGAGGSVHPLEYLDGLAAVADAPIYCWVDSRHGPRHRRRQPQEPDRRDGRRRAAARSACFEGERADTIPRCPPPI